MWKTIQFEPNYEVSILGEVRNKTSGKVKSLRLCRGGYFRVTLYPSGKTYNVHRLVALTFIDKGIYNVVNHKNGVKTDNSLSNLEWCDNKHNVNHAYKLGLNSYKDIVGEKNPSVKLNWSKVKTIRDLAEKGKKWSDIAKMYGVQYNCIKRIVLNITWK